MLLFVRVLLVASLISVLAACQSQPDKPHDPNLGIKDVMLAVENDPVKIFNILEPLSVTVNQGMGIFNHDNVYTVLAGDYRYFGHSHAGNYYAHVKTGLTTKSMGITEKRVGGVFIPHDENASWYAWSVPNTEVFIGGAFIFTGVTDAQVVHRVAIPIPLVEQN